MNESDTDRGRRTEGPITVTVRQATPDNKWDYPHLRVDAEKDGIGAVTTLMCELTPELLDPKDPKTSAHPPDSRKFSDNQIYYLGVGPEYGDSPKLSGQFYTTVRRAGYRVVASHPDVHDDHRTRVWVEEREYATRRNRS